jgi:hypothetical protein
MLIKEANDGYPACAIRHGRTCTSAPAGCDSGDEDFLAVPVEVFRCGCLSAFGEE